MTLTYVDGETFAHRLDPRTKLLFQAAFALAAFVHTTPTGLAALSVLAGAALVASRTPPVATLLSYRPVLPFLVAAPLVAAVSLSPPGLVVADAVHPALSSYRVVLLLLVSAGYVRTTPVRESRAAVQRLLPGRVGVLLGAGVGFVLRFLPLLRRDLATLRAASDARLGDTRSLRERVRLVGVTGLRRTLRRADRFALALQARCFAWNPTLPALSAGPADVPVALLTVGLVASALV